MASSLCNFVPFSLTAQPSRVARLQNYQINPPPSSHHSPTSLQCLQRVPVDNGASSMFVVCPSVAYSNTLFFKSAYNVQVIVGEDEPEEVLLRRFKREVMKAGVIQECKRRRFFENSQEEKKRRVRDAAKRNRRRRPFRAPLPDKQETLNAKKDDDDGDNWDMPEGNLPF
ncbi:hypothetical protein IFM89_023524 [Coptis chinensis]|uniref:30S ribosomal protein S21, chloroplastic n=1 Tax=Coptis chinensis TaxID=261450 RepID=A0A835LR64_9MAGN|nr:hypothetical protein IFM89_023524 [Coptis chinensis]